MTTFLATPNGRDFINATRVAAIKARPDEVATDSLWLTTVFLADGSKLNVHSSHDEAEVTDFTERLAHAIADTDLNGGGLVDIGRERGRFLEKRTKAALRATS